MSATLSSVAHPRLPAHSFGESHEEEAERSYGDFHRRYRLHLDGTALCSVGPPEKPAGRKVNGVLEKNEVGIIHRIRDGREDTSAGRGSVCDPNRVATIKDFARNMSGGSEDHPVVIDDSIAGNGEDEAGTVRKYMSSGRRSVRRPQFLAGPIGGQVKENLSIQGHEARGRGVGSVEVDDVLRAVRRPIGRPQRGATSWR